MNNEKGITAYTLRWIAFITMAINHFGNVWCDAMSANDTFFHDFEIFVSRGAFIIFAFFIAEGMVRTHSRKKYLLRLFVLSLLSEFFYDSALESGFPDWSSQNVVFTLFLGALIIYLNDCIANASKKRIGKNDDQTDPEGAFVSYRTIALQVFVAIALSALCSWIGSDYGFMGTGLILIFYYLRNHKEQMMVLAAIAIPCLWAIQCIFYYRGMGIALANIPFSILVKNAQIELPGILALPLLWNYKGEQGKKMPRWLTYGFYPGHLCLAWLWLILFLQ